MRNYSKEVHFDYKIYHTQIKMELINSIDLLKLITVTILLEELCLGMKIYTSFSIFFSYFNSIILY